MEERTDSPGPAAPHGSDLGRLVRAIYRLTIAIWCLVTLLVVFSVFPWVTYFFRSGVDTYSGAVTPPLEASVETLPYDPGFDNDFHARPPEEQIKRATVILLTQIQKQDGKHKEVISEIVKTAPGTRFYYKVGDEYELLSHTPSAACEGCEGQGQVVFLLGNPAHMSSSYS